MAEDKFNKEDFMAHYKGRGYSYESIQTEIDSENNSRVVIKELEAQVSKQVPEFSSKLRHRLVEMPDEIY
ncbi:hypothetical protein [Facklamia sp. P13055]|uniref:hypothetical protein n=1 Tax=unclassified Facklamia TaxID=2622293 RepID=UPI003D16EB95